MPSRYVAKSKTTTTRHRAYCETQRKYVEDWRSKKSEAEDDCEAHKKKSGNGGHVMRVFTEIKSSVRLK